MKKKQYDGFLRYGVQQTEFLILGHFFIWGHLCPFRPPPPPYNPENQNFEKMKKVPEDIIILHVCHK